MKCMATESSTTGMVPVAFAGLFWVSDGNRGQHANLSPLGTTIGTGGDSDILLDDATVSPEHARMRVEEGTWYLYDLASNAGTTLGGESVYRHQLADGDTIGFGATEVVFRVLSPEPGGVQ